MKAIIQAGGSGTRLRPVTYEIPKPLLTVKRKPILNHVILFLRKNGIKEIAVIASAEHRSDFKKWLASTPKKVSAKIVLFFEEKPAGTFGSVKNLRKWLGNEAFIFANGDTLLDFDLKPMREFHDKHGPTATLALMRVKNGNDYGMVSLDKDGYIVSFTEKPANKQASLVSSGLYILEPSVFEHADQSKSFVMIEKDIFPALSKLRKITGRTIKKGRFYDCGTFERWEKAIREW